MIRLFLIGLLIAISALGCGELNVTDTLRIQHQIHRNNHDAETAYTCIQDITATEDVLNIAIDRDCIKDLILEKYPTPRQIFDSFLAGDTTYEKKVIEMRAEVLSVNEKLIDIDGEPHKEMEFGIRHFWVLGYPEEIDRYQVNKTYTLNLYIIGLGTYKDGTHWISTLLLFSPILFEE